MFLLGRFSCLSSLYHLIKRHSQIAGIIVTATTRTVGICSFYSHVCSRFVIGISLVFGVQIPDENDQGLLACAPAVVFPSRSAIWPFLEKSTDSPRIRADSWGAWKPVEFSASTKSR